MLTEIFRFTTIFFKYRLSDFMASFNFVYLQNVREFNEVIDRYD